MMRKLSFHLSPGTPSPALHGLLGEPERDCDEWRCEREIRKCYRATMEQ